MLELVSLQNFKSYESASLELAPLSFLIGANASGKSNALEAIRLMSWLARGTRLDDIERAIQGGDTLVRGQARDLFRLPGKPFQVICAISEAGVLEIQLKMIDDRLVIVSEGLYWYREKSPLYRIDGDPGPHSDEIRVMYNNFKPGGRKPHIPCSNRQAIFYQLETPGRFAKEHRDSQRIIPSVTRKIRETLRNIMFLDPRPATMRDYAYAGDDEMREDGSNLSSVLHKLCTNGAEGKEKILGFIRSLPEQDIVDIDFIRTDRNDVMVRLVESFGGKNSTVDAPLLSDGTLRVLAVGATLLGAPEGALVIIEEIDNGVHPSRADNLVSRIQAISKERNLRVLLTSHNPALLDALPDDALGDVLCCYRDPDEGDSRIVRLKDLERYSELVARGPLGELMTRRVLDRFLKDKTSPEERTSQALSWLEDLKGEVAP